MEKVVIIDDIDTINTYKTTKYLLNVDEIAYIELDHNLQDLLVDRIVLKGNGVIFCVSKEFNILKKIGSAGVRFLL